MEIVLNLVIIVITLIIAYWWANQGLFSALLHLIAVIVAGAIAIALWEPLTFLVLGRATAFDPYAWGVTLVGTFAVALFLLRFSFDRLIPANINLPNWANLAFGLPVGAAAGILTMGIYFIGAGFIQGKLEVMGYDGYHRVRGMRIEEDKGLWLPVHKITNEFYSWLSVTSLRSSRPMRHVNPELDRQVSQVRDTFSGGRGQISMPEDAAQVVEAVRTPSEVQVKMRFTNKAQDFNDQLTLSQAQVRLISDASGWDAAEVEHPYRWMQDTGMHQFDDVTHYATSEPGKENAELIFHFRVDADFVPKYIQVKGNRYLLPTMRPAGEGGLAVDTGGRYTIDAAAPDISTQIATTAQLPNLRLSVNGVAGKTIKVIEVNEGAYIETANDTFQSQQGRIDRKQQITSIYQPAGTCIVQVRVDRSTPANLFTDRIQSASTPETPLRLIDANGSGYTPIGYFHQPPTGGKKLLVRPGQRLTYGDLPALPTTGDHDLILLFRVTENITLAGLMVGDITVGATNVQAIPRR